MWERHRFAFLMKSWEDCGTTVSGLIYTGVDELSPHHRASIEYNLQEEFEWSQEGFMKGFMSETIEDNLLFIQRKTDCFSSPVAT